MPGAKILGIFVPGRTMCSFLLFAALLYAGGLLLLQFAPAPQPIALQIASQFLLPEYLKPKPGEQFIYAALVAAVPLLLAVAVRLTKSLCPERSTGIVDPILVALLIAAGLTVLCLYPAQMVYFVSDAVLRPVFAIFSLLFFGFVVTITYRWKHRQIASRTQLLRLGAASFAMLFPLAILVTGSGAVTEFVDYTVHLDATLYSVVQTTNGGTCLDDVRPQYGCYGEFLRPVFVLTGLSVAKATIVFALLQAVSALCAVRFSFRIMSLWPALAASIAFTLLTNALTIIDGEHYFQYWPIRLLFPCLSLEVATSWQRHASAKLAALVGLFAGLSLFWNLDSGVVVLIALGGLVLLGNFPEWRNVRTRLLHFSVYAASIALTAAAACLYLSLKSNFAADFTSAVYYQRIFVLNGFLTEPMSRPPDVWTIEIAVYGATLCLYAVRISGYVLDAPLEGAAYLAILAIGLFSYFAGRSIPFVAFLPGWPVPILFFFLLDRATAACPSRFGRMCFAALPALAVILLATAFALRAPEIYRKSVAGWRAAAFGSGPSHLPQDVAFIRATSQPAAKIVVLAPNQASLLAETGRHSALPGPGMIETLLTADADRTIVNLVSSGPRDLYVGMGLLIGTSVLAKQAAWVKAGSPRILSAYQLAGISPNGSLLHFVRRQMRQ